MLKRFLVVVVFLVLFVVGWYFQALRPVTSHAEPTVEFEVSAGQGIDKIGENLSAKKLIRSRTAFKITVIRLGISSKIQAGFFQISPNMNIIEIAQRLTKAQTKQTRVTIQEGLRNQEIAQIIDKAIKSGSTEIQFSPNDFVTKTKNLEGQLFPDTYDFGPKDNTDTIIKRLNDKYLEVVKELNISSDKQKTVTVFASLLEREAANSQEMPDVAGVLQNRLDESWPLQVDATVQYAMSSSRCKKLDCDWWPQNITINDLKIKSAFNTYANQGLPPAPISNPGRDSLKAASSPNKNNYWFYLHDEKGVIHFSKTIEEHNRNVCVYLKKDCQ